MANSITGLIAKIIGGVLEGPVGWAGAAAEFGGMVEDKIAGKF